ncbi:MAG TPA: hypothetical protein VHM91_23030 [Verrucomicrobiales bacterium]|nr:hypothetical protein [Verrucomicrobiales bacterium]
MKYLIPLLTLASSLMFSSCDSKQEQERKKALERKADSLEEQAKKERKEGEKKADNLENQADRTRDQK